ncbi:hypothetical protein BJY52DRAFT_1230440 [Lactarius psammicola]|nr:hypothetical protein BJY52DRAFT_1230440 [Lactarius psammicola]
MTLFATFRTGQADPYNTGTLLLLSLWRVCHWGLWQHAVDAELAAACGDMGNRGGSLWRRAVVAEAAELAAARGNMGSRGSGSRVAAAVAGKGGAMSARIVDRQQMTDDNGWHNGTKVDDDDGWHSGTKKNGFNGTEALDKWHRGTTDGTAALDKWHRGTKSQLTGFSVERWERHSPTPKLESGTEINRPMFRHVKEEKLENEKDNTTLKPVTTAKYGIPRVSAGNTPGQPTDVWVNNKSI